MEREKFLRWRIGVLTESIKAHEKALELIIKMPDVDDASQAADVKRQNDRIDEDKKLRMAWESELAALTQ